MNQVSLSDSVYLHFGTSSASTGAATNADSTPTVVVAEDGTDMAYSPTVSNVATGLYKVQIDATSGNGFEAGRRYSVYAVATVGGVTGRDGIGEFEVLATDLNTGVASVTGAVASVTAAVTVGTINANVVNASALAADAVTEIQSGLATSSALATVQADTDDIQATLAAGLDVAVSTRLAAASYTAPLDAAGTRAAIGLAAANLDTQIDALPTAAEIVAAQLTTQITEAYRANGAAPTLAEFMSEVLAHLGEIAISGTTKTLKKLDHSTVAQTFTLNSATAPTAITRAS